MGNNAKKIIVGVAGAVASAAISAWVTKLLKDKPLAVRAEETKTTVADIIDGLGAYLRNRK